MKYSNTLHYELQGVNPEKLERLSDTRFSWREERMQANRLVRLYHLAGYEDYADRVEGCATWLQFRTTGDQRELMSANFCKLRLCPMCTARGAVVRAKLLSQVMDGVQAEQHCQYIFLTLTVENVTGDKLGKEIGHLASSWNRLLQHKAVKRAVKGWFRALEITRNGEYYHPHIHAIIAVEDDYFARKSGLYITQAEWVRRWKMALKVDYNPSVRISKTNDNKGGKGAVLEAAKYVTKSSDYISDKLSDTEAAKIVGDYTRALYHRRLTAFGGWLKEMAQRIQAADLDNVDLVQGDDSEIREDLAEMIEEYGWHFGAGDYVLARRFVNPLRVKREVSDDGKDGAS
uniref:Replication protein n=1 Tax=uncultured prokaryote TaxID=198431 RepID=A0A0H5Q4S0_9ZZZZ|nr:hypothetical protein [uncultured prokaryote]